MAAARLSVRIASAADPYGRRSRVSRRAEEMLSVDLTLINRLRRVMAGDQPADVITCKQSPPPDST